MIKVALVKPPAVQNLVRGAGVYTRMLVEKLSGLPDLKIQEIPFNFWRLDYSEFNIIHFLYFDPFFLTLPPMRNQKTIVTLMDLTPIVLSNLYPRGLRGEIKWQLQKFLISNVDHILTLSDNSKGDINRMIGIPLKKITTTYLAGDEFSRTTNKRRLEKTRIKYNLPNNFIFYLGDINPNKNILSLLRSLSLIRKEERPVLLMSGRAFQQKELPEACRIREEIDSLRLGRNVILPGFIPDEEVQDLFTTTKALVHPAIYEGFGLPVIQALSCGTPVICGRNSCLPEIAGDAAIYADVDSPQDLADKISAALKMSKEERVKKAKSAIRQASKFTWKKTARETFKVYRTVVSSK